MIRTTDLAHLLIRHVVGPGDWVIDATVGNGHDTAFLAGLTGPEGRVFGFDVQAAALEAARSRLSDAAHVTLFHAGHEEMLARIPVEAPGTIAAVMFNLGYLPGADKSVITKPATTLAALEQALRLIRVGGVVTAVLYPGHAGGAEEAQAVFDFAQTLPGTFAVTHSERLNTQDAIPSLIAIERVRF